MAVNEEQITGIFIFDFSLPLFFLPYARNRKVYAPNETKASWGVVFSDPGNIGGRRGGKEKKKGRKKGSKRPVRRFHFSSHIYIVACRKEKCKNINSMRQQNNLYYPYTHPYNFNSFLLCHMTKQLLPLVINKNVKLIIQYNHLKN